MTTNPFQSSTPFQSSQSQQIPSDTSPVCETSNFKKAAAGNKARNKKPTLQAICRTENIEDFKSLLADISKPVEVERREQSRAPQSLFLHVQPLSNNLKPVGEPFQCLTRDVSSNGVGFLSDFPVPTKFVRVGANAHSVSQSVARVCYNKAYYGEKAVYLVGVEFISG